MTHQELSRMTHYVLQEALHPEKIQGKWLEESNRLQRKWMAGRWARRTPKQRRIDRRLNKEARQMDKLLT